VSVRTGHALVLEVRRGYLLLSTSLGHALRDDVWMPIEIRHEQFVGLSVVLGERTVLEGLPLNGFAPRPSWQLAVAASSADDAEGTDEHWINDLRVVSGSLLERADVPVRVSLNGQQLHPPTPLSYTLRALPAVLAGTPQLGSTTGGTLVQLRMASTGAPSRVCRFGDADEASIVAGVHVPATLHHSGASGDTLHIHLHRAVRECVLLLALFDFPVWRCSPPRGVSEKQFFKSTNFIHRGRLNRPRCRTQRNPETGMRRSSGWPASPLSDGDATRRQSSGRSGTRPRPDS